LADDADDDAAILSQLLERARISNPVIRCRHGREVILRLIELWTVRPCGEWPCLLLLDGVMPTMDGFAVLQWLRERPADYGLRTVIVSNSDEPADIERAKAMGAAGYLIKYPAVECLAAIVKSAADSFAVAKAASSEPATVRELPEDASATKLGIGPVKAAFE
jgi:CheY-like chemotaxis protein